MKAYIERPISEKPEKDGSYIVREIEELGNNLYAWFEDGYWHPAAGSIRCINNELECWLQPVEIAEESPLQKLSTWMDENWTKEEILSDGYLKMFDFEINYHLPADVARSAYFKQLKTSVVNTDVLVNEVSEFLKTIPINDRNYYLTGFEERLAKVKELIAPFTTPQPDKEEKK